VFDVRTGTGIEEGKQCCRWDTWNSRSQSFMPGA